MAVEARIRVADDDDDRRPGPLRVPLDDASFEEVDEGSKFDRYLTVWEINIQDTRVIIFT